MNQYEQQLTTPLAVTSSYQFRPKQSSELLTQLNVQAGARTPFVLIVDTFSDRVRTQFPLLVHILSKSSCGDRVEIAPCHAIINLFRDLLSKQGTPNELSYEKVLSELNKVDDSFWKGTWVKTINISCIIGVVPPTMKLVQLFQEFLLWSPRSLVVAELKKASTQWQNNSQWISREYFFYFPFNNYLFF